MGISILDWIFGKGARKLDIVEKEALTATAQELGVRLMAWNVCVDIIASMLARCDFRTFVERKEVREEEHWLWNVEPNSNQNSTEFLHKMVHRLLSDREVLMVEVKGREKGAKTGLFVADSFAKGEKKLGRLNTYTDIVIDDCPLGKTLKEPEVLHLVLRGETAGQEALKAMMGCYEKLLSAASGNYTWNNGVHLKVKVGQVAAGGKDFKKQFKELMDENARPWISSANGVLPQFDGYEYSMMEKSRAVELKDIREITKEIFTFTAVDMKIPPVLALGEVADSKDAMTRLLTFAVDPLADQLQEEINRKRYTLAEWRKGNYLQVDSSAIVHFDMFANAAAVEKLIGSGAFSINDVLKAAGCPEINEPWANQHWLTLNIGTIEQGAKALTAGKEEKQ